MQGMHLHVGLSLVTPAFCALIYMLTIIIQPSPLYEPQYSIPLMGMMLGNSLTGVTVGVKTLLETMSTQRATVEWRLCMGATRWEAVSCVPPLSGESVIDPPTSHFMLTQTPARACDGLHTAAAVEKCLPSHSSYWTCVGSWALVPMVGADLE